MATTGQLRDFLGERLGDTTAARNAKLKRAAIGLGHRWKLVDDPEAEEPVARDATADDIADRVFTYLQGEVLAGEEEKAVEDAAATASDF